MQGGIQLTALKTRRTNDFLLLCGHFRHLLPHILSSSKVTLPSVYLTPLYHCVHHIEIQYIIYTTICPIRL